MKPMNNAAMMIAIADPTMIFLVMLGGRCPASTGFVAFGVRHAAIMDSVEAASQKRLNSSQPMALSRLRHSSDAVASSVQIRAVGTTASLHARHCAMVIRRPARVMSGSNPAKTVGMKVG